MVQEQEKEQDMSLVDHLAELRKRIAIVAVTFVVTLIIGFIFAQNLLEWFKARPAALNIEWNVFQFTDGFIIYFKCAFLVSIVLTLPVIFHQIWLFVRPGLTKEEAKGTVFYIPLSFFLFMLGACFAYFIVFPFVIGFMSQVNQSIGATETYGMSQYFSFMFNVIFPISIVFEMPVVILFLTKLGILTPDMLRKSRKISYFVLVVIGVLISPPDFISDIILIAPLISLFEISILLSAWSIKRKNKLLQKQNETQS